MDFEDIAFVLADLLKLKDHFFILFFYLILSIF